MQKEVERLSSQISSIKSELESKDLVIQDYRHALDKQHLIHNKKEIEANRAIEELELRATKINVQYGILQGKFDALMFESGTYRSTEVDYKDRIEDCIVHFLFLTM